MLICFGISKNLSKFVEEVATKVMQGDKAIELFETMEIVSLNMGNLTLETNSLKNRLATREKEKAILHEELKIHVFSNTKKRRLLQ